MTRRPYTKKLTLPERLEFYSMPEPNSGCLLWLGGLRNGYGMLLWHGKPAYAHRLAYEQAYGPIPKGMHVCHKCDVPACINPDHLFLGTHQDNMDDKTVKGRGALKLTKEQVGAILVAAGTYKQIAENFDIDPSMVGLIKRGKSWAHVSDGGVLCR